MLDQMFFLEHEGIHEASARIIGDEILRQTDTKFNYVKYRQAIQGLLMLKMDPEMAKISTLTTAKTMGVQSSDILSSAKHFIELLDQESDKFNSALQSQYSLRVAKLIADKNIAMEQIKSNQEQIAQLTSQLKILESEIFELDKDIKEGELFIEEKQHMFQNTVSKLKDFIHKDIQSLEK
ncbi:MAG: hypothetical protein IPO62_16515 [Saprospiraceae bacterium]|nr:hypothetical protein [Saprospiraceae bacterium]MBK9632630.1 hypothetical protein [Saprospiraceae bacterium]